MPAPRLDRLLEFLTGQGLVLGALWAGLALFTLGLVALTLTRWGQSKPLRKCLVMSLLAHVLLAGYSTTVKIFTAAARTAEDPGMQVRLGEADDRTPDEDPAYSDEQPPWESFVREKAPLPKPDAPEREPTPRGAEPERPAPSPAPPLPSQARLDRLRPAEAVAARPQEIVDEVVPLRPGPAKVPEAVDAPQPQRREQVRPAPSAQPGPGRDLTAAAQPPAPQRPQTAGLPATLFPTPAPLPRMTDDPSSPEPGGLDGLPRDLQAILPRGSPAPALIGGLNLADGSSGQGSPAHDAPGPSTRLFAPSLAPVAGRRPERDLAEVPRPGQGLVGPPSLAVGRPRADPDALPEIYRARNAPNRAELAAKQGATDETEKAVQAALKWLAANQEDDGRWHAARHGAGRELLVGGRDRQGAGARADTATTGLALLAFLARGYTHHEGEYQENVRRGLEHLLRAQAGDGNLGGQAETFAFMYSHAIATFAMSEAYAMARDDRLREPVRRAVAYTLAAQNPDTGGWRYKPRDPGDTSQLGWQVMALKSAELGGISFPEQTKLGAARFLRSVSSGRAGGLAAYRPTELPTPAMTAEALVCRQFLGARPNDPACREAGEYLLREMPGRGDPNLYYWYYGTLGMYQLQGVYWRQWNEAMAATLVARQKKSGPLAGSWDPDTRWDNYGGRVYSTALSALCLEVYYRFLPLYVEAGGGEGFR